MLIEAYFQQINKIIASFSLVKSFNLITEKAGIYQGFIRGEIYFLDNSILHLREFVDVETVITRDMYSYQYMDEENHLIFRYDNTRHHKQLNLPNYPHHKHDGNQNNIISSNAPMLVDVLQEIGEEYF